jgi:hypothetical protein
MSVPCAKMVLCSVRVDKRHIGYVKWLLESHDGMATPTTRPGEDDVVDLLVAPDFVNDFEEFLLALEEELNVERVDGPEAPPLLSEQARWPEP